MLFPARGCSLPGVAARTCRVLAIAMLIAVTAGLPDVTRAQLPVTQIHSIAPAGACRGQSVEVRITSGADLEGVRELEFSHAGISATPLRADKLPFESQGKLLPGRFMLSVAPDVPPGIHEVRAIGRFGVSNPRAFVVGEFPEITEQGGNNTAAAAMPLIVNSVVNASIDGGTADWYKISLVAGQAINLECWAERIDSRMDPAMAVFDASGRELAHDRDTFGRDALIDFVPSADGDYLIRVHDSVYSGGPEYFYRLAVGACPWIDFVYPPVGPPGKSMFTLYGRNLPDGEQAEWISAGGQKLQRLDVEIELPPPSADRPAPRPAMARSVELAIDAVDYRFGTPAGNSNPVAIGISNLAVILEVEPNDEAGKAQPINVPCEFVGQFGKESENDWISFDAKAGQVYWLDVVAERRGLVCDPYLLVQQVSKNADGSMTRADILEADEELSNAGGLAFNTQSHDPVVRFVAPSDGTYQVLVRDQTYRERFDPRHIYRLRIRPEQPGFTLAALSPYPAQNRGEARPWNLLLRKGGREPIDVVAARQDGFNGPIRVSVNGLPAGMSCPEIVIAEGQSNGTLVFSAATDSTAWWGSIRIFGTADIAGLPVVRESAYATVLWPARDNEPAQNRLTGRLAAAITDLETAALAVDAGQSQPWSMARGGKLQVPVKLERRGEIKSDVTFTPLGLPPNVNAAALAFNANTNEGSLELQLNADAAPGTYSFHLQAQTTIGYRRDEAGAAEVAAMDQELGKFVEAIGIEAVMADATLMEADQKLAEATTQAEAAKAAVQGAEESLTKSTSDATAATAALAEAQKNLDADSGNQDLAAAQEQAKKAAAEAETARQTAEAAKTAATANFETTTAALATATANKTAADALVAEVNNRLKLATDERAEASKRVAEAQAASAPKDLSVIVPSNPITLAIEPMPCTLTCSPAASLRPGTTGELVVAVQRKFDFVDPIQVEVSLPAGPPGVRIDNFEIAPNQTELKVPVTLDGIVPAGTYRILLIQSVTFQGQSLRHEQPLELVIAGA